MILPRILPALLLVAAFPLAAASDCEDVPHVRVCAGEWVEGNACADPETVEWGYTYARAETHGGLVMASVEGSYSCWHFQDENGNPERFRGEDDRATVRAADKRVALVWGSFERSSNDETEADCWTLVETKGVNGETSHDVGCPAGAPPKLDWGRLLA